MHAFGAIQQVQYAKEAYNRVRIVCPLNLVSVRDELAARFELVSANPRYSWSWVFEEECKNVLLEAA